MPTIHVAGDYQTEKRMAQKLKAIPIPDVKGRTVLDLGCDHGAFSKLASDMGAKRVLGVDRGRKVRVKGGKRHIELAERNAEQGWERCEFRDHDIAIDWPDLGRWDVVFCFSLYHHLYGLAGDHERIWDWLASVTCPDGVLLWEGPVDTRDPTARDRAKPHGNYTRAAILEAAGRHFHIEAMGDALHRPNREVFRLIPRKGEHDHGNGVPWDWRRVPSVHFGAAGGTGAAVRVAGAPRDAQRPGDKPCRSCDESRKSRGANGARDANRAAPVVARRAQAARPGGVRRADRPGREEPGEVPGDREPVPPPGLRPFRRRDRPVDQTRAIILGGGECVWDDVAALEALTGGPWNGLVVAVNDIGCWWPGEIDHWVTLHHQSMPAWVKKRAANGYPAAGVTWGRKGTKLDRGMDNWAGGSSGMFGACVARDGAVMVTGVRVERGVLCGIPMEPTPHFRESHVHRTGKNWASARSHWRSWTAKKDATMPIPQLRGWLRSMSGKTRELLGAPDLNWLSGDSEAAA